MALIKCPECRNDVSTSADACPHCGYPLKSKIKNNEIAENSFPKPIDSYWVENWKKRATKLKWIWTLIHVLSIVFFAFCMIMLFVDQSYGYYSCHMKTGWIVMCSLSGFWTFISLVLWLIILITCKVRIRNYDGYNILVYAGFKNLLIVENIIQDSSITNRFMYGWLPNKKQVKVEIYNESVKIGVTEKEDTIQLI